MNIKQLYYLTDIAKTHSLNMSAQRLYTSQQAISYEIKKLEQELGITLLSRKKTGVTLTNNGEKTLIFAKETLKGLEDLKASFVQDCTNNVHRPVTLQVVTSPLCGISIFKDFFVKFNKHFPYVKLIAKEIPESVILEKGHEIKADIILISTTSERKNLGTINLIGFNQVVLLEDASIVVLKKDHPLCKQKTLVTNQDIYQYQYILYNYSHGGAINTDEEVNYMSLNFENAVFISSNIDMLKQFLVENESIFMSNKLNYHALFENNTLTAMPCGESVPIYHLALYRNDHQYSELIKEVVFFIKEHIGDIVAIK